MEPNQTVKFVQAFLKDKGYKILDIEEDDMLMVRFQMQSIHIFCNEEDGKYITMMLPYLDTLDEGDAQKKLAKCIDLGRTLKVVKIYPVSTDNVVAAYEFYYDNEESLGFQLERGFPSLIAAKVSYNNL